MRWARRPAAPPGPPGWVTCGLGPYNFEFMTAVKREIAARYRVDGIFVNRWEGSGMCYCVHCQEGFRAATGRDLPRTTDVRDPAQRDYLRWRQERLFELWALWDSEVRRINPDACVIPNTGGGATSRLDMKRVGERAPMMAADRQARHGLMAPWAIGMNAKEYRATLGRKPVAGLFSVGVEEPYRWKDSVQSADEIRLWVADLVANGMRPWFSKFAGALHDPRWLEPEAELWRRGATAERLRNEAPRVGLAPARPERRTRSGWYQASSVTHPSRWCDGARSGPLAPFKTLSSPRASTASAPRSPRSCAGAAAWWRPPDLALDETGRERGDFGLAELFGVSFVRRLDGPVRNAYLRLEHETNPGHPLLRGLEDAPRIIHGVWPLEVEAKAAFPNPPVTLIPSYPDLPMEKVYVRRDRTGIPQVFLREVGAGRVAYFPWDIDRTFWDVLAADHLKLMGNAVAWATNESPPVAVAGPGVLDVTVWRQKQSLTVHLVNLTNPMMMKGPVRELLSVGEQRVRVRLPEGTTELRLLVSGTTPSVRTEAGGGGAVRPYHEVIAIDL